MPLLFDGAVCLQLVSYTVSLWYVAHDFDDDDDAVVKK